ncbi:MAG: phosphoribosyl-ATP diphosphatase [Cardiobacteriaceae bacterium]|nr:phosphoribosyl-ATP diphosphatase [Cardiobacteriaceae bacterium]
MEHLETLAELVRIIDSRKSADGQESYVASLLHAPVDKVLKKIGEEATETVIAAKGGAREDIVYESADLLFHLLVMLAHQGIALDEIFVELRRRFGLSGHAEKAQRKQ